MRVLDGRTSMSKIHRLMRNLRSFYGDGEVILDYQDIEYAMAMSLGVADARTITRYFSLMEKYAFLVKAPKAQPIRRKKEHMGRNRKTGTTSVIETSGNRYAWSSYMFGPRAPNEGFKAAMQNRLEVGSPRSPFQIIFVKGLSRLGVRGEICVCARELAGILLNGAQIRVL